MSKSAFTAAFASLVVACAPAAADWRSPIAGARPILPARFTPFTARIEPPPAAASPSVSADDAAAALSGADAPIAWITPLVDRRLSSAERAADLAPELLNAISRIEPIYDPTRVNGPETANRMSVSAGTAAMDNVFADRWRRADLDANVNQRVSVLAMAWHRTAALPCEAFWKNRARAGYEQPALTALSAADCDALRRDEALTYDEAPMVPVVPGTIEVPTFAAPMPGSRMSSDAFWAARRLQIQRVEAELRLRQVWHGGKQGITASLARR